MPRPLAEATSVLNKNTEDAINVNAIPRPRQKSVFDRLTSAEGYTGTHKAKFSQVATVQRRRSAVENRLQNDVDAFKALHPEIVGSSANSNKNQSILKPRC